MVQLTAALRAEMQRMLQQSDGRASAVRVTRPRNGTFELELDDFRAGDEVLSDQPGGPRLIIAEELAAELEGAILHFRRSDDRYGHPGVEVLGPRQGTRRAEWTPPRPAVRANPFLRVFRTESGHLPA